MQIYQSVCLESEDSYLNVNIYLHIVHTIRIKERVSSDKMDIRLGRQSAYQLS